MPKPTHSGLLVITRCVSFTPSDTKPINATNGVPFPVVGFSIAADGNVAIKTKNQVTGEVDAAVTIALKAGVLYPISPEFIMDTNTDATSVQLYG